VIWLVLVGSWVISNGYAAQEPQSVINTIQQAWKKRETQVFSLDCEWSAQQTFGAKTLVYHDKDWKTFFLPEKDLTVPAEYRFRLDGDSKMRYEYTGSLPVEQTRHFEPGSYVSTTDGREQKSYYGKDQATGEPRYAPVGFIGIKERIAEAWGIHLRPLLALYRPSCPELAPLLNLAKFSVRGQAMIGGRDCLLLERTDGGMPKCELAIDMKRDCVPVRVRQLIRNDFKGAGNWVTGNLAEINYLQKPDGSWTPASWKTASFKDGATVIEQMSAIVKRLDINVRIPESDFRFDFPVGSFIHNQKNGERYILREGGEKRHVTQAEMDARAPYKLLLATRSGEAIEGNPSWFPNFWLIVTGLILLGLIGWLGYWRLFPKRKGGTPNKFH
jgi:hypothetical protein